MMPHTKFTITINQTASIKFQRQKDRCLIYRVILHAADIKVPQKKKNKITEVLKHMMLPKMYWATTNHKFFP